ncbi:MAG: aspartate aminotransferase family protein, partial [Chloroflexota bacterium]
AIAEKHGVPIQTGHAGTMFGFYFLKEDGAEITDFASAKQYAHVERYAAFFHAMLAQGVYFAPSQYEAGFVSAYHTPDVINDTLDRAEEVFADL